MCVALHGVAVAGSSKWISSVAHGRNIIMDRKAWKMSVLRMALIIVGTVLARTEAVSFFPDTGPAGQDALEPDIQPIVNTVDGVEEDFTVHTTVDKVEEKLTNGDRAEEGLTLVTPEEGLTLLTRGDKVEGLTLLIPGEVDMGLTLLNSGDKVEESLKFLTPKEGEELGFTLLSPEDRVEEVLTPEDKVEEVNDEFLPKKRVRVRKMPAGPRRWPNATISYMLVGKKRVQRRVRDVFAGLEDSTCLRFTARTKDEPYLLINVGAGKCWTSSIGYPRSKVTINLGPGCRFQSRITHEVLHAAGFLHEHTRPDRDQYVTVNWDNIRTGTRRNFEMSRRYKTLEVPYDYKSIMHYGDYAFAVNQSTPTLVRLQGTGKMGGTRLTHLDILRINTYYRCHLSPPLSF